MVTYFIFLILRRPPELLLQTACGDGKLTYLSEKNTDKSPASGLRGGFDQLKVYEGNARREREAFTKRETWKTEV